ncbi:hypothetical protein ACLK19_01255 [Escherichia coli]
MSVTAQRRDIRTLKSSSSLPKKFKRKSSAPSGMPTVADICATNETLWNSWKQSLLRETLFCHRKAATTAECKTPDMRERFAITNSRHWHYCAWITSTKRRCTKFGHAVVRTICPP